LKPLDLVLGVGQELVGLRAGLGDELLGILLGVGNELLGVLVCLAQDLLRLRVGRGGLLLGRCGPLLRFGDQLPEGCLRCRQAFCLPPFGFFAAGGKRTGLLKTIPANLTGVLWGAAMVWGASTLPIPGALGISVAIAAFAMCIQARWSVLSFIPGAFAGTAAYFGNNLDLLSTSLALVIGACLGWISEFAAGLIINAGSRKSGAAATPDAAAVAHN